MRDRRPSRPRRSRPQPPQGPPRRRRLASREGTILTSVALPAALHERLMLAALRRRWTAAEIIRAALEVWLRAAETGRDAR